MLTTDADDYRAAVDRVAALAQRLSGLIDLPTAEQLDHLLIETGWVADAVSPQRRRFTAGDLTAHVRVEQGTASIGVTLANLGSPEDLDDDQFDDDDDYEDARDQLYRDAESVADMVANQLDLEPADALAIDELVHHGSRVRLRAGHWAVTVAAVQAGSDLPLLVEVDFSYGADLPGRLTRLVAPPQPGRVGQPVDWEVVSARTGVQLPPDYRWLMENYGCGTFDGYLALVCPEAMSKPLLGEPVGVLRYVTPFTLPVMTTADGAVVSWVLDSSWDEGQWHMQVASPGTAPWETNTGLLQFLVTTLSGAYRVPQFRSGFPSTAPTFTPA